MFQSSKINLKKATTLALALLLLSGTVATAIESSSIIVRGQKETLEVEVLINNYDEDYIANVQLDDGTYVKDYDYTIKQYIPSSDKDTITMQSLEIQSTDVQSAEEQSAEISQYFNYAAWITRDNVVSLSLDPVAAVRSSSSMRDSAWAILANTSVGFAGDSRWQNTQVMKWQFNCHYTFANSKDYWNLEPHRTASSYISVIVAGCNP